MRLSSITFRTSSRSARARTILADGEVLAETSRDVLKALELGDGDRACAETVLRQVDELEPNMALERAFRLLGHRERSCHELTSKLRDDGYSTSTCGRVVQRLLDLELLDDSRFAALYVRSKLNAGWGAIRIRHALRLAGVSDEIVDDALTDNDDEAEYDRAVDFAMRHRSSSLSDQRRVAASLVRRGYSFDTARRAVRSVSSSPR